MISEQPTLVRDPFSIAELLRAPVNISSTRSLLDHSRITWLGRLFVSLLYNASHRYSLVGSWDEHDYCSITATPDNTHTAIKAEAVVVTSGRWRPWVWEEPRRS
jgi:hypothetical protein